MFSKKFIKVVQFIYMVYKTRYEIFKKSKRRTNKIYEIH